MNDFHRDNLDKLATYLESNAERLQLVFSMGAYATRDDGTTVYGPGFSGVTECGTICCAAGNGPRAGIPAIFDEGWSGYTERVFGAVIFTPVWDWLFSSDWIAVDNTVIGAAKRIRYFLKNGVPRHMGMCRYKGFEFKAEYRELIG